MKVIISGYYGFGNIGDEAILEAAVQGLRGIDKSMGITVLSRDPGNTELRHSVQAISRRSLVQFMANLINADAFISGGGGLLQDVTSRRSIWYYLSLIQLALWMRKRVVVFAQGFGPIQSPQNRYWVRRILNRSHLILLRDEDARREAEDCGIQGPPMHVTGDPSFILDSAPPERVREIMDREGILPEHHPLIAMCVRRPASTVPQQKLDSARRLLARTADHLISKYSAKVLFVNFQPRSDVEEATKILNEMSCPAGVLLREYLPRELLGIIQQMSLVIGIRLHSIIFATMTGTPFVALSYAPKVKSFAAQVGQPAFSFGEATEEEFIAQAEQAIDNSQRRREQLQTFQQDLRKKANRNFEILSQFLYHGQG